MSYQMYMYIRYHAVYAGNSLPGLKDMVPRDRDG